MPKLSTRGTRPIADLPEKDAGLVASVEAALLDDIAHGRLPLGDRLPPEQELARSLGVSRSILREALGRLRRSGLIRTVRGSRGGSFVRQLDTSIVTDAIFLLVRVNGISFEDVVEARRVITPVIAGLAAERATEEDVCALEDNLAKVRDGLGQDRFESASMMSFHLRLTEMTRNPFIEAIATPLAEVVGMFVLRWWARDFQEKMPRILDLHEALVDALRRRDVSEARQRMTELMDLPQSLLRA